jgi:hypothetical protein
VFREHRLCGIRSNKDFVAPKYLHVAPIVGHVNHRNSELRWYSGELLAKACAQFRVEARQRLVEQQQVWLRDERARKRDALLFAAR